MPSFRIYIRVAVLLFIISFFITKPVWGLSNNPQAGYATLTALEQTAIPADEPITLAKQLRHIGKIPPPPTNVPVRQVGEQQLFWVSNDNDNTEFQVTA